MAQQSLLSISRYLTIILWISCCFSCRSREQQLLLRARKAIQHTPKLSVKLENDVLVLEGAEVSREEGLAGARKLLKIPGVNRICYNLYFKPDTSSGNTSPLSPEAIMDSTRKLLKPYTGINISWKDSSLLLSGNLDAHNWKKFRKCMISVPYHRIDYGQINLL